MHRAGEQELKANAFSQQFVWGQGIDWGEGRVDSFVLFYKGHVPLRRTVVLETQDHMHKAGVVLRFPNLLSEKQQQKVANKMRMTPFLFL